VTILSISTTRASAAFASRTSRRSTPPRIPEEQSLKIPALYDLWWDPGENYDIVFNGAAPTRGDFKTSTGRYSGQDNGWIGLYINPVTMQFWDEMKTHPNIPYKPFDAGSYEQIPPTYR
jgi:hypothetical protein